MKYFLTLLILSGILIKCSNKNNLIVTPCDTCSIHTDTVPASITILTGDQMVEVIYGLAPIPVSVIVKNKAGKSIKGITVSFTTTQNSGSVSPALQSTDDSGTVSATWILNPQVDTSEELVAKVMDNDINFSVRFHASVVQDLFYNFAGTLTMDSIVQPMNFLPYSDSANRPDPFTIPSDPMALSNGVAYPFELDSLWSPHFQLGEHGESRYSIMTINHFVYPKILVSYEVNGLVIMDVTATYTYTDPEPFTVTMQWEFRSGAAYLLETVSSPTRGTFTNGRTGTYR